MDFAMHLLRGLLGVATILAIGYAFSSNRKAINWRLVGIGLGLQLAFAILIIKKTPIYYFFELVGQMFTRLLSYTAAGAEFVFGPLSKATGVGFIFAFQILPTIIFIASLMAVLYYLGLMQPVVKGIGWFMARVMRISGAESLATASNIFVGQTEAPLIIRPYVGGMTRSELLTLMTGGMATLAGGVLAAYVGMLGGDTPAEQTKFAVHLLSASMMNAPAAILFSKMLIPETETPLTGADFKPIMEKNAESVIEAAAGGAADGLKLAANVAGMLLAFIALIALVNELLGWVGAPTFGTFQLYNLNAWIKSVSFGSFEALSMQSVLGFLFAPFAWLMGVESRDILQFGRLLGEKIILNEFVAYSSLVDLKAQMTERSVLMATYALCGFANISSIAIQIGGIGGLAPERRSEIANLGFRAVLAGAMATCLSATVAGVLF
ncbi:MAG: NupC/NupG family nucleoside CNT transporter [Rhodothermia bacterium]|nr:NupC/NupG family nucleoside CNT transporter [Rhodothermia bacterium]